MGATENASNRLRVARSFGDFFLKRSRQTQTETQKETQTERDWRTDAVTAYPEITIVKRTER